LNALLEQQQTDFNAATVGRTLPVLIEKEGRKPGQIVGRSPYLQPVWAMGSPKLIGQIVPMRIDTATRGSLTGALVAAAPSPLVEAAP
jgi:tRNA-2-methylthio-N6-dimethylallyladenosine synthase